MKKWKFLSLKSKIQALSKAVEQAILEANSGPRALCWTPLYDRK